MAEGDVGVLGSNGVKLRAMACKPVSALCVALSLLGSVHDA